MAPFEGDLCPSHEFRGRGQGSFSLRPRLVRPTSSKGPLGARSDVGDELDVLMTR
jgi:hypothetical protein